MARPVLARHESIAPDHAQQEGPAQRWPRLLANIGPGLALAVLALLLRTGAAIPMTEATPLAPLLRLADVALVGVALVLAGSLGRVLLRALRLELAGVERAALATGLGLGAWSLGCVLLGLVGLYRPSVLLVLALLNAALGWSDLRAVPGVARRVCGEALGALREAPRGAGGFVVIVGLACFAALLGALTPPHHFDALAYHLAAPQRFLETGRIAPLPDVLYGNLPLGVEMLFGVGLAFGSDVFAQVLHLAFGGLTALTLWAVARRSFGRGTAWLACGIFLATPLVVVWSRVANVDLPLACFLLLALLALLRAGERGVEASVARRWALLAGIFAGTALATKYQALFAVPLIGILVAVDGLRLRAGGREVAVRSAAFWGAAVAVAVPWYAKNWLVLGNPIWPLFVGGRDFDELAVELTNYFARGMAISPHTPLGYLLLPVAAYLRGSIEQKYVILSPLFIFAIGVAFLPKRRATAYPLLISGALAIGWAQGFQELRYLLPICAPLSLATAVTLRALAGHGVWRRLTMPGLYIAAVITLALTALHVGADRPVAITLGQESRDAYLRASVTTGPTYRATQFLGGVLRDGERVRFFNDAQVYYVPYRVEPDHLDLALIALMERNPQPEQALRALQDEGIAYLLVNEGNVRYREQFDPEGRLSGAKAGFDRLAAGWEVVYRDGPAERPSIVIYRVPKR